MRKLALELGGNAHFIVDDDATDINAAVATSLIAYSRSNGQTCACLSKNYVLNGIYDAFDTIVRERVKVGPAFEHGVTHGALINKRVVSKIAQHVEWQSITASRQFLHSDAVGKRQ